MVEPAYRDDNQGLWDLPSAGAAAGEAVYDSVRFEQSETEPADREREAQGDGSANVAQLVPEEAEVGIAVARYPEWDYMISRDRNEWTTVSEYNPADGSAEKIDAIFERYPETAYRIDALVQAAKVSRPTRLRRQREGDRLDLEATIGAAIDLRAGLTPSSDIYARLERRWRDLSVLVLIDASQSTNDIVKGAGRPVLELERDATSLLAHAMDGMGDPFAIHAFCSDTREDVHYYRLKDFDTRWDTLAKWRLAGVVGKYSTRMGAALRHAGRDLAACHSYRKLLLLVSDGEPSDVDIADRRYLVEDARARGAIAASPGHRPVLRRTGCRRQLLSHPHFRPIERHPARSHRTAAGKAAAPVFQVGRIISLSRSQRFASAMDRPDYRPFVPAPGHSNIAGATPRAHAQARLQNPRAKDLFATWAKLGAEPFKGTHDRRDVQPGLFSLQPMAPRHRP